MTTLTLELPAELYDRLNAEAVRKGAPIETVALDILAAELDKLSHAAASERERATAVLRAAGLLGELSPEEKRRAEECDVTLEEVQVALDRAGGPPLSEVIIEMRGPKL
jgi:hypothetical protein